MTASTPTAGYPAHAVAEYAPWTNQHGATFTDWRAQCGATGTRSTRWFHPAGRSLSRELCPQCFPGQRYDACAAVKPAIVPRDTLRPAAG